MEIHINFPRIEAEFDKKAVSMAIAKTLNRTRNHFLRAYVRRTERKTGVLYRTKAGQFLRRSAPGQYPGQETGLMGKSIRMRFNHARLYGEVWMGVSYARYLEDSRKMLSDALYEVGFREFDKIDPVNIKVRR